MKKFNIEIIETLSRVIEVEAASSEDAVDKVNKQYRSETIVLDTNDFVDVNIFDNNKQ